MHRRTRRGNRLGLALLGFLLLAGGVALVLAHLDVIPAGSDQVVYPRPVQQFVADQDRWLYWVLGAVSVLLALWFLRWLLVQVRTDSIARMVVDRESDGSTGSDPDEGRTVLPAGAATAPVEDDIEDLPGVRRARADLVGNPDAPELWITVHTEADADLGTVRTRITDQVVPDARASLELSTMPLYLTLVVGNRTGGRTVR